MNSGSNHPVDILTQLTTQQLDERLAQELHNDVVDEATIKHILSILRERDKNQQVEITPQIQHAWDHYQQSSISASSFKPKHLSLAYIRVASVMLAAVLLFSLIPKGVQAETFWSRLANWTTEIFEFLAPHNEETAQSTYVFNSDHPSLQTLYNIVVELGITEPVVPMWLPEESHLVEYKIGENIDFVFAHARIDSSDSEILIEIRRYDSIIPGQYEKDSTEIQIYEVAGITHYIMRNIDRWNVAWTRNNLECFLSTDCQETDLYEIIKSIYTSEGKQ